MNRPHFLFRPNMQNEDHRRAWRLLQEVPEGQKSAFIVRAILQKDTAKETGLPDGMMGFLDALMDE